MSTSSVSLDLQDRVHESSPGLISSRQIFSQHQQLFITTFITSGVGVGERGGKIHFIKGTDIIFFSQEAELHVQLEIEREWGEVTEKIPRKK